MPVLRMTTRGPIFPRSDGHDGLGLIDEPVPGVAAMIDDIAARSEDAVGQPIVAEVLPDVLSRVQLGGLFASRRHKPMPKPAAAALDRRPPTASPARVAARSRSRPAARLPLP